MMGRFISLIILFYLFISLLSFKKFVLVCLLSFFFVISQRNNDSSNSIMRKIIPFLLMSMAIFVWAACSDDNKQIYEYLEKNYSDREVKVTGDIVPDSAFCPMSKLESTKLEIMGYRAQLMMLLEQDPDSAYRLAKSIKKKYADENTFANMAYPSGKNNRLAYRVRCEEDGEEHYVTFYKNVKDETIQYSSFDVEDVVDSLSVYYSMLMNGVNEIVKDEKLDEGHNPSVSDSNKE